MKKTIIYFLIFSMLLWIPSCGTSKNDSYSFSLDLKGIKQLYEAAMESEETYNETMKKICPNTGCTRDQFLKAFDQFKDYVIIYVPRSARYIQYEINFERKGIEISISEDASQKTSVNMVKQKYIRGGDDCRAEGIFYSSSSPEPIYDGPMQKMIQDGIFKNVFSLYSDNNDADYIPDLKGYLELGNDKNGYRFKEAYIYEDDEYNLYYFSVYSNNETYVGSFEFKAYKEEDGRIPYFYWSDFGHFSFITLEEYVKK